MSKRYLALQFIDLQGRRREWEGEIGRRVNATTIVEAASAIKKGIKSGEMLPSEAYAIESQIIQPRLKAIVRETHTVSKERIQ